MFNFLTKLIFSIKKPKIILVAGEGSACATEAIFQVLKQHFEVEKITPGMVLGMRSLLKNKTLVIETEFQQSQSVEDFKFLVRRSSLPILVVTQVGEIPFDQDFFAGDRAETNQIPERSEGWRRTNVLRLRELAKALPAFGHLVLNFDDETVREIKDETNLKELTFGFQQEADFRASDINLNTGTNFKINYKGNIVPIWLERLFGKEQIYSALAAASVGIVFDINLVEISQALKNYQSLSGKMRLIEGIKHSWILDDSENASPLSMAEALEILGKIKAPRKIAVLGDILAIGKYSIEAHESIGERVARVADLLFTFGPRAKFIAQGAQRKGMALEKIFQYDTIEDGKIKLQDKIKQGDLILIDGSKEMKMEKIVEEIKAM